MYLQLMYFYSEYKFAEWYHLYCSFLSGNRSRTVLHTQAWTTSPLLAPKQPCYKRIKFLSASFLNAEVGLLIELIAPIQNISNFQYIMSQTQIVKFYLWCNACALSTADVHSWISKYCIYSILTSWNICIWSYRHHQDHKPQILLPAFQQ